MSILTLKIEVCGNPDRGQDPDQPPFGAKRNTTIRAASIDIIRLSVEEFQTKNNLGGGNWKNAILYRDDEEIGRMSWNGRVWDKAGKEILL
jgi:hypothetical protein